MSQPNRQPAGVPTGGQFAPDARARSGVSLGTAATAVAEARGEEAYGDYATALNAMNRDAAVLAATAVRAVFGDAARVYVKRNPDYIHDGEQYAIDRITGADGAVLADEDNWPDDGGEPDSKWSILAEAQWAIGAMCDNDIDVDSGSALMETPGVHWDEEGNPDDEYIDVAETAHTAAAMIEVDKASLAKAKDAVAEKVTAMNEANFAAIDAICAERPEIGSIVISRSSDKYYAVESVLDMSGEEIHDFALDQRLDRPVQNLHEGHKMFTDSAFLRGIDTDSGDTRIYPTRAESD